MDDEVKIPIGLEADEASIDSTIKAINNRLRSLKGADTKAAKEYEKVNKQALELKGKTSKADREQLINLREQMDIIAKKRTANMGDRKIEEAKLEVLNSQKQALQAQRNEKEGKGAVTETRTDSELRTLEGIQKTAEVATKMLNEADSATDKLRNNVKRTAAELKLAIQQIASTMPQQPSKSFDKDANERIKLLQQSIAKAQIEASDKAKQLGEPWKLKLDAREMEDELKTVSQEVETQTAEVERLKQAYDDAKASASEIANAFKPGTYSVEELTLEMEKIKGAEQDANKLGEAYKLAQDKLGELSAKQEELANKVAETRNRAEEMKNALMTETGGSEKVSEGEKVFNEYEAATAKVIALKMEIEDVYDAAEKGRLVKEQDLEVAKQIEETLRGIGNEVKNIQETGNLFGETEADKAAKIPPKVANKEQIQALNAEKAALQQTAAQYYYKLRAIKMLGFVVNSANAAMDKFGKTTLNVAKKSLSAYAKLIPGVNSLRKAISGANAEQKKLNRETNKSAKTNGLLSMSFKDLVKNILKYGLGIRSVYVLFSKLRKAVTDGIGSMAKQIDMVNAQMSSVVTSMNQMKAGITAAVQPLLNALAPALERVAAAIAEIAYQVASFISAFTGQSVVYRAARVWTDYAASLDKTGKSAKKAKKELAGFDELNVLHTQDNSGNEDFGGMNWDPVEPSKKAQELAERIKAIFKKLFTPIKAAWDKIKNYVYNSWAYAIDKMKALGESMARDFWKVWEEQDTQKIFEDMFLIMGDMGRIVGNLAKNFKAAWDETNNGYRILKSIRDVIGIIVSGIRECTEYTANWAKELIFTPALTALADNMQTKLVPAVQQVVDLFKVLYEQILLKIIKNFIEKGLPQLIDILGNLVGAIGNIAENIRIALQSGSNGIAIVSRMEELFQIVADMIEDCSEKTKAWAAELDFKPLLESIEQFLEDSKPLIEAISGALSDLWNNTLLPFWSYLIEEGFPKLLDALGEITGGDWSKFSENAKALTEALEPFFELAWETLVQILKDVGLALKDFLNSDELGNMINSFKDWAQNADPEELAKKIEFLVKAFVEIKAALSLISKVILPVINGFMTIKNVFNQMGMVSKISKISADVAKLSGTATTAETAMGGLGSAISSLAVPILIVVGVIATMIAAFGGVDETIAEIKERVAGVVSFLKDFAEQWQLGEHIEQLKAKFGELSVSMTELRPVFEFLLDVLAVLADVIGVIIIGAIDFVVQAISGAITVIKGVIDFIGLVVQGINEAIAVIPGWINTITNFVTTVINKAKEILTYIKTNFAPSTLIATGKNFINGLLTGITSMITIVINKIAGFISQIKSRFSSGLSASTLLNVGYNLLVGLVNGIINGFNMAYQKIRDGCTNIINIAKSIFDIGSPSKVFEQIGLYDMEGLTNGIDEGSEDANKSMEDAMKDLVPDVTPSDDFANSFLDSLTSMKSSAIEIINSMVDEMSNSMSNLDTIFSSDNWNIANKMSKLSTVSVPSIAQGKTLPSSAEFAQSMTPTDEFDYGRMASALSSAIVEAMGVSRYNNTDQGETVINIDGREVFRAVRKQNDIYRKSTGRTAF